MRQREDDSTGSTSERVRPSAVQKLLGNVHMAGPDSRWVSLLVCTHIRHGSSQLHNEQHLL